MPMRVIGVVCLILIVVSVQSDCIQSLQIGSERGQKVWSDFNNNDMKAVETGAIELIPVVKDIIANCTNLLIPDSRRTQACLTKSMNLIRVVSPMILYPETKEGRRAFLDELPKSLSTLYTECIEYDPIRSHEELTKKPLKQKDIEKDISRCLSKGEKFSLSFPRLAEIIVGNAPFEEIRTDLTKILVQFNSFRTACNLPLPEISPRKMSLEQCISGVRSLFLTLDNISRSENETIKLYYAISAYYQNLPSVLSDCGLLDLHGEL